jgi:hypothetical protein
MAMSEVMPEKAQWIKDSVASFDPKQNTITLANGESVRHRIENRRVGRERLDFRLWSRLTKGGITEKERKAMSHMLTPQL